jgi:long-chain-fatty-acid--[acyl-carrier-protein] ligase
LRTPAWDVEQPAVILFTSGSESVPKGVPLSHRNVLSNLQGALTSIQLDSSDVLYGFLPPFHSFGFTVATLLPLTAGLKTAYYPNPTESRKLARGIGIWHPTVICGPPTFISGILKASAGGQMRSLRLLLSGAEKAPAELFTRAAELCDGHILEGYGITETAPVLTFNRMGEPRIGVGKPIANVELLIVDPASHQPLPTGQRGLILAHGPNVFAGYLGKDSADASCEVNGKRWYITGDLGVLDEPGNLTISGRLKRFVKIGGEMISLPAMEAALQAVHPNHEGEVRSAIASVELEGGRPVLGLFTAFALTVEEANRILKEAGFSNLARLQRLERLDAIPVLGTGKTDYQTLNRRLAEQTK